MPGPGSLSPMHSLLGEVLSAHGNKTPNRGPRKLSSTMDEVSDMVIRIRRAISSANIALKRESNIIKNDTIS